MFLELLIAGHLATYKPTPLPEPEVQPETIQVIKEPEAVQPAPPPEPTLEEKIRTNYYNCDEATHYIRADNAQCLAKPVSKPQTTLKARTQAQNSSYATPGNTYQAGQCTHLVASMRYVPNGWGDATNWKANAQRAGWTVSKTPVAGAIAWRYGHVSYVRSVGNGTVTVTEQNYRYVPFEIRTITVPTTSYTYYLY